MHPQIAATGDGVLREAVAQLAEAAAAQKCWSCGCLHTGLAAIERAFSEGSRPAALESVIRTARERLAEVRYECLGCEICYPAIAINILGRLEGELPLEVEICPASPVEAREGWPPLPGAYRVLRFGAPVAVCTLTDGRLADTLAERGADGIAIVGTLQTENLGIERLIQNMLANPNLRFLVVCGVDSRQAVGHLPGQSLIALAQSGLDDRARIIEAAGKRPVIRNLGRQAVEYFRRTVEVVDLVGQGSVQTILDAVMDCAARNPGPAEPFAPEQVVTPLRGYLPERMVSDPAGYFVVYLDRPRHLLSLEHFRQDGTLTSVVEGTTAPEVYLPAVERGLVSRLDHAAYLGRELARAEQALASGEPYVQDAAPEAPSTPSISSCGCEPSAQEEPC
jgi:tetrahydromethanopterin S-methyltransferase subunit A